MEQMFSPLPVLEAFSQGPQGQLLFTVAALVLGIIALRLCWQLVLVAAKFALVALLLLVLLRTGSRSISAIENSLVESPKAQEIVEGFQQFAENFSSFELPYEIRRKR